jgi:osmotically-inducible protein OsmY
MAACGKQSGYVLAGILVLILGACDENTGRDATGTFAGGSYTGPARQPAADETGVRAQPPAGPEDSALGARVRSALTRQPGLRALSVDVNAASGAVTLYGTANTPAQRELAGQLALGVEGVRSVTNHLIILKET